jgi:diguanylate cyclase (GGDEF)-like protein
MGTSMNAIEGLPLERISLFRYVTPESLEGILDSCRFVDVASHDALLVPGRENREIFILLSGRLRVHLHDPVSEAIAFIEPGELVGELSVVDGELTSAYVVADEASRLLVMNHEILWSLVSVSHAAACNLLTILSRRVRNANKVIAEKLLLEHSFHRYGTLDALTGMHNRHWLNGVLPRLVARCAYTRSCVSVLMLDIDSFKVFNDAHGHLCGDRAIHTVAQVLIGNLRPAEMAARYGGDEFLILLPDVDLESARLVAERLLLKVRAQAIPLSSGASLPPLTISVGLAVAEAGGTTEELISAADAALYRAKAKGRDTISE